jgi:hypothetical protein
MNKKQQKNEFMQIRKFLILSFVIFPSAVYADSLMDVVWLGNRLMQSIVFLIFGLAVMFFLWGILKYIFNGSDEKQREESKKFMLWGIVGLTVMVSVWGLVSILANIFGMHLPAGVTPTLPYREY